jgi:MSHA biogenesis protein MshK
VRPFITLSFIAALLSAFAQTTAYAQAMHDPMRPPSVAAGVDSAAVPSGRLQGVLTSPQRKLAVIDGQVVPLGGPVRDAKLAGVSDSAAVLRKNGERDVLLMHPNIEKKPAAIEKKPAARRESP